MNTNPDIPRAHNANENLDPTVEVEAAELAAQYLAFSHAIDENTAAQAMVKDQLLAMLPPFAQDLKWELGPAVVAWVKGRESKKFDSLEAKKQLALAGVDLKLLEKVWKDCTDVSTGKPSLRVSEAKEVK